MRALAALEIIRAAYKTQGHEVVMEYVPWARAESGVKNGSYDIVPFTWRTDARVKVLLFSTAFSVATCAPSNARAIRLISMDWKA